MQCPICASESTELPFSGDGKRIKCELCGTYIISGTAIASLSQKDISDYEKTLLSHYTRKRNIPGKTPPQVNASWINDVLSNGKLPDPQEQSNLLILWMGSNYSRFSGGWVDRRENFVEINVNIGAADYRESDYILGLLEEQGYLQLNCQRQNSSIPINIVNFRLTNKGWVYFKELQKESSSSRIAFMAMQFGNEENGGENYIVERAVRECFNQAVSETGFLLKKVSEEQPSGLIDDHIIVGIRTSRFVIADLTDHNKGAYWEAGFAEGLGKPVIYTCHKSLFHKSHFDTNHRKTIIWHENDWKKAAQELKDTIRATLPDEAIMEN